MLLPCLCHASCHALAALQVRIHLDYALLNNKTFAQFRDDYLWRHAPLEIGDGESGADLAFCKAPWDTQQAAMALASTGMYQALGNIWWLCPFPDDEPSACLVRHTPTWDRVLYIQWRYFRPLCKALPHSSLVGDSFPVPMLAHVDGPASVRHSTRFPGYLTLVTGHVYLYAWYLGMMDALQSGWLPAVASLWRAGLTVTIRLRAGLSSTDLALLSIQHSAQLQAQDLHGQGVH